MRSHMSLRNTKGVLGRIQRPSAYHLQQRRELWPLIVGGMAVFAAGTVLNYGYRAFKAMDSKGAESSSHSEEVNDFKKEESNAAKNASSEPSEQQAKAKRAKKRVVQHSIGFDIGTSNARVALRTPDSLDVLINHEGRRSTPVQVMSGVDGFVAGHVAKMQRWSRPSKVSSAAHLGVGLSLPDFLYTKENSSLHFPPLVEPSSDVVEFELGGERVFPRDAYYRIAMHMCDNCTPAVNNLLYPCVVAVPTRFNAAQKAGVISALRKTGISDIEAIADSQCAVIGAMEGKLFTKSSPELVVVVDVGGYYSQISMVKFDGEHMPVLLESTTVYEVGGEVFDSLMVENLSKTFKDTHGIDLTSDPMAKQRLFDAVESSKLELSNKKSSRINIPFITASANGPIHLDETYSRSGFDNVINPAVSKLSPAITAFIEESVVRANQEKADASSVVSVACLLVGGGARVGCVQSAVAAAVDKASASKAVSDATSGAGVEMIMPDEPEEVIIKGAAALSKYSQ